MKIQKITQAQGHPPPFFFLPLHAAIPLVIALPSPLSTWRGVLLETISWESGLGGKVTRGCAKSPSRDLADDGLEKEAAPERATVQHQHLPQRYPSFLSCGFPYFYYFIIF